MIGKLKEFGGEVVKEMKKVSWPTKQQLKDSTVVVVVTTLVITTYTFIVDIIITKGFGLFFGF